MIPCIGHRGAGACLAAALLFAAAPALGQDAAYPPVRRVHITFYALNGEAPLGTGVRTFDTQGGRTTIATAYSDPAGREIQRTVAVFEDPSLATVSYRLDDTRSGAEERIERKGDTVHLAYRERRDAPRSEATLPYTPALRFTATVEPLIQADWRRLVAGERVAIPLIVPGRLTYYTFRLQRVDAASVPGGGDRVVLRLDPDTWLLRALVDPIHFFVDARPPHRLREYRGRYSVRDPGGGPLDLRVLYEYPDDPR